MTKRGSLQRSLGRIIISNRPIDRCICCWKKNLDEVAAVLCQWEKDEKKGPSRYPKKR